MAKAKKTEGKELLYTWKFSGLCSEREQREVGEI